MRAIAVSISPSSQGHKDVECVRHSLPLEVLFDIGILSAWLAEHLQTCLPLSASMSFTVEKSHEQHPQDPEVKTHIRERASEDCKLPLQVLSARS